MTRIRNRLAATAGGAVLAVVSSSAAGAQKTQRTGSVQVKPDNRFGQVEVRVASRDDWGVVDGATAGVRPGDPVQVGDNCVLCLRSSADGSVAA
ncbi:MAG: hypothetical protein F4X11_22350 [Acidobacteria bacterium]|nr:hypothetical protein [Acidobacteriota bacterium]